MRGSLASAAPVAAVLGDPYRNPRSRRGAGSATVVYGRSQAGTAQLSNLGDRGYRIDGAAPSSTAGTALGWAGDLDGDGRSDVVLGAPGAGRAYLVTGR